MFVMPLPAALWAFLCCLAAFHCSEFALACVYMRDELSLQSWLISAPYAAAMSAALAEFGVEAWLAPGLKRWGWVSWAGLAMVVAGECIRKAGMLTAKASFTHHIRRSRRPQHRLVTWGIYRYIRHPGYLGWSIWCIGTQLLLCNPLGCVVFAVVAWRFFAERIDYEEAFLEQMFGDEYVRYRERTPTYMPFIS